MCNNTIEHVTILSKYTSHLDIRFGELESEQRLHQLRVDRHIKSKFLFLFYLSLLIAYLFMISMNS
jgi:hypothetical protein